MNNVTTLIIFDFRKKKFFSFLTLPLNRGMFLL